MTLLEFNSYERQFRWPSFYGPRLWNTSFMAECPLCIWKTPHMCGIFHTGVGFTTHVPGPKHVWVFPLICGNYHTLSKSSAYSLERVVVTQNELFSSALPLFCSLFQFRAGLLFLIFIWAIFMEENACFSKLF